MNIQRTSSHALLSVLAANGIDRAFLVPGESYLGVLDALNEFPNIDVVTCRHESGAGFMACADARLTGRPGVVMVSRGPGATNASIAVHTAQQDAVPLILIIGQVRRSHLRREAFQEIDYQKMFGSIAKWVVEVQEPEDLAAAAFKAVRIATSETPGPVVIVVPEDIQQQPAEQPEWKAAQPEVTLPDGAALAKVAALLAKAHRPLIIAGGAIVRGGGRETGREALFALAEKFHVPVAVSFRQHDVFPNTHELYVGDLGLSNPKDQMAAFADSDLILAIGTRLGDITTQSYTFPVLPKADQCLVHVHPDAHAVGLNYAPDVGVICDPAAFIQALTRTLSASPNAAAPPARKDWAARLRQIRNRFAAWPAATNTGELPFSAVIEKLAEVAPRDALICLDAGTFGAPVYRHFSFVYPQRLMAPLAGAMGYGTPSAVASQLRYPDRRVVCLVGDGGFLMTGNEIIAAVERSLPIVVILSNNNCYGSIRLHQDRFYPGRHVGTTLSNPDFVALAKSFGMQSRRAGTREEVGAALQEAFASAKPCFIEVPSNAFSTLSGPAANAAQGKRPAALQNG